MKTRFRLIRRGNRSGIFYCVDTATGRRTDDAEEARQIVEAHNQAQRQPSLKLQIAKVYLAGSGCGITQRAWQQALDTLTASKRGANRDRWQTAGKDPAFSLIR